MPRPSAVPPERLSGALMRMVAGIDSPRVAIGDLLKRMDGRAHSALLILFALPNVLPAIPGTSAVLGVPLIYLTLQLAFGRAPWLPGFIANRSLRREVLTSVLDRAMPWLQRGERYLHPRLTALTGPWAERLAGTVMVLLSLIILHPIPLGNMLPALAIILFALGLMERDGIWMLIGAATTLLSLALVSTLLWALVKSAVFVVTGAMAD